MIPHSVVRQLVLPFDEAVGSVWGTAMRAAKKLFFFLGLCVLCCSAVFLLLLTVAGFLYGIYSLFFGEPELNGIVSSRSARQAVLEALFCCIWILGFGTAFVANIAVLRKIIRNPQ